MGGLNCNALPLIAQKTRLTFYRLIKVGDVYDWPSFTVEHDTPGPTILDQAFTRVTGRPAIFTGVKFVGDAAFLQRDCGVPRASLY